MVPYIDADEADLKLPLEGSTPLFTTSNGLPQRLKEIEEIASLPFMWQVLLAALDYINLVHKYDPASALPHS